MTSRTARPLCCALAAVVAACGNAATPPASMAVRDSAGVRIVEYAGAPDAATTLRLSAEPVSRVGANPGDHLFARVALGALRPDGGAVVLDVGTQIGGGQEVLALGPDGSVRAVMARPGQGPGEVRQVLGLALFGGDSVLVEDDGNARFLVFADTALARSVSLAGSAELGRGLRMLGVDATGAPLMSTGSFSMDFTTPWLPGRLVRLDLETLRADTVGSYDMVSFASREGPQNPFRPFGLVAVSGRRFVHMRSDVPEVVWQGADGGVRQIVRWEPVAALATEDDLERLKASRRADLIRVNPTLGEADMERFLTEQMGRLEVPAGTALPLALTLRGDDEGRVWMSEWMPASGSFDYFPTRYDVVGADGTWFGSVTVPPRFRLLDVAAGRVLGVQLDALGVESVVVHELVVEPAGG